MSLAEAVESVAGAMVEFAKEAEDNTNHISLTFAVAIKGFARELRTAIKAAEGTETTNPIQAQLLAASPEAQHRNMIEKAKAEFRDKKTQFKKIGQEEESIEESFDGRMVNLVGGNSDNTMMQVDPQMPEGAKMPVNRQIYVMKDGALHYSKEETIEWKARQSVKE